MGRKKGVRTKVLYARVKPLNYEFIKNASIRNKVNVSKWLDSLLEKLRETVN